MRGPTSSMGGMPGQMTRYVENLLDFDNFISGIDQNSLSTHYNKIRIVMIEQLIHAHNVDNTISAAWLAVVWTGSNTFRFQVTTYIKAITYLVSSPQTYKKCYYIYLIYILLLIQSATNFTCFSPPVPAVPT